MSGVCRQPYGEILPASELGGLRLLAGFELYITTWDYDGNYRALVRDATPLGRGPR